MTIHSWISSSFKRNFPSTRIAANNDFTLEGALNEKLSFQICIRNEDEKIQNIKISAETPIGWHLRIRRVGYVPMPHPSLPVLKDKKHNEGWGHVPGYVPDPLFDETNVLLPKCETNSFWISLKPGENEKPGTYLVQVKVASEKNKRISTHTVKVVLHDVIINKMENFHISNWFYLDALIDWYKTDYFDETLWKITEAYMLNMVEHGQTTIYVPAFTPSLDGVKRPTQLIHVSRRGGDTYSFDWTDVKKYVQIAEKCGFDSFEWCHLFTQWGANNAIRIYEGQGKDEKLLWGPELSSNSKTYRLFLKQFLPELHNFVKIEKILDKSFFHLSDEPHGKEHRKQYKNARLMLKEIAPWMNIMDALSEVEFAKEKLVDTPVPYIGNVQNFLANNIPCWCYYCSLCGFSGKLMNHLLDTPLAKIAMHGMLFYKWPLQGFLHWGYNYWYYLRTRKLINPFAIQDGLFYDDHRGWVHGDSFWVYPGENGPIDSIRWEVFAESLQDYALLQTLNIPREGNLLLAIKSFDHFPLTEKWRMHLRSKLFSGTKKNKLI